jgi:hypothetical protein
MSGLAQGASGYLVWEWRLLVLKASHGCRPPRAIGSSPDDQPQKRANAARAGLTISTMLGRSDQGRDSSDPRCWCSTSDGGLPRSCPLPSAEGCGTLTRAAGTCPVRRPLLDF